MEEKSHQEEHTNNKEDHFQHVQEANADAFWITSAMAEEKVAGINANDFKEQCHKAAEAIAEADVLVLFTGAGFSADSGLAVYADVAKIPAYERLGLEYHDICQPHFLHEDPELFYGFWGQCFNDYRQTQPHDGYIILRQWRDNVINKQNGQVGQALNEIMQHKIKIQRAFDAEQDAYGSTMHSVFNKEEYTQAANAFYCFTSNVDAHSYDIFKAGEIYECHGNIEMWQCGENETTCPSSGLWRAPLPGGDHHRFVVDPENMRAPQNLGRTQVTTPSGEVAEEEKDDDESSTAEAGTSTPRIGHTTGQTRTNPLCNMPAAKKQDGWWYGHEEDDDNPDGTTNATQKNWPVCPDCGRAARPAILMFGDCRWKPDSFHEKRWELWGESMLRLCNDQQQDAAAMKVCIVEIGCGNNVPTCRYGAEELVERVVQANGEPTLVRINPDFPACHDPDVAPFVIPVKSKGLEAIREIDRNLSSPRVSSK